MSKKYTAIHDGKEIPIEIKELEGDKLQIISGDKSWEVDLHQAGPHHYSLIHEGKSHDLRFHQSGEEIQAFLHGEHLYFQLEESAARARKSKGGKAGGAKAVEGKAEIAAQMPGKVVAVKVKKGDKVEQGQGIVVVEAMKMENEIAAPKSGSVTQLNVSEGQSVETGEVMVVIE